jgi:malate dehydrogenase (oxaloacetate-decarboxylating)
MKRICGILSIKPTIAITNRAILARVYTPGVAAAVKQIVKNPRSVNNLTIKGNSIAVITDGSAVLGLGNVGPYAALPVMEGKCAIFKEFADIDAYPICLATQNVEDIVTTIKNISPGFAAINLEDIAAPRCFEIESRLQNLPIPVMHDDQHATAIVVLAGLINAVQVVNKSLSECTIVIVGAGAAGTATAKLLHYYGLRNMLIVDSQGILSSTRNNLDSYKKDLVHITNPDSISGDLDTAAANADILIGVSTKNIFTKQIITSMNKNPIVFALANPDPEILPQKAKQWGVQVIATGRSDYANQINNAIVFPGFFKGLMTKRITKITDKMKIKAAVALAHLVGKPAPNRIIPPIFDKRIVPTLCEAL